MVTGFDVHPIAVEMAKATLATALPPGPTAPLQVFLADSMLPSRPPQTTLLDTMPLPTADGKVIEIPSQVIESPHATHLIETLVRAALGRSDLVDTDRPTRQLLSVPVAQLTKIMKTEGDHVWRWYIGNNVAPARLASLKAAAVVGNPPWLVENDTPQGTRKEQLADMATRYRLRPGGWSAKGDLAAVFSARVVDLYLAKDGLFGFVLPGSALIGQTWAAWRKGDWGNTRVGFDFKESYDDMIPPPFPHAPNGTSVVAGRRIAQGSKDGPWGKAQALLITGDWHNRKARIWRPRQSKPSPYAGSFRRGAVATPLGLCLVITPPVPAAEGLVTVTTKASTKAPWKGVQYTATIDETTLWPALRSQTLQPFICAPDAWYIAPISDQGMGLGVFGLGDPEFAQMFPATYEYWTKAEECYAMNRAKTAGATLSENVDRYKTLTGQLTEGDNGTHTKVFYNKSGNTLRAARGPNSLIADDKLYWYNATTRDEALYLTAILNAEYLQDAWRESKTSNLHFDLNPLKHVPVPLFDSGSDAHVRIAQLATEAEQDPGAERSEMEGIIAELLPGWG